MPSAATRLRELLAEPGLVVAPGAVDALAAMGFKILTLPADLQLAAIHAMRALLAHLKAAGTTAGFDAMATFAERDELIGLAAARALEAEFIP